MALVSSQRTVYTSNPLPLGSRAIRVLDLHSLSQTEPNNFDELLGSLRVISLSESPRFVALSYVWGSDTSRNRTITCCGHKIIITENCYDALRALQQRFGAITIWVDSICINQMDEREKSDQILLMEEIYTWAETV